MIALEYYSNVKDGKLQQNVRQQIAAELKQFEGKRVEIKIQKLKSTRSIQQNRFWWLLMIILSSEVGYTKEEMHEICKLKFLKKEKITEFGEVLEYAGSTAKLSKSEFADLIADLQRWSSETFNVYLPDPGEQMDLL